jgi:hypothetical protein
MNSQIAVEHGGGQKDPQYGEVEEKRAPYSQKVARTEVFDTKVNAFFPSLRMPS